MSHSSITPLQSTASALLALWESAYSQAPVARMQTLIAAMMPEASSAKLAQLQLGQCNHALLQLREQLMGVELISVTPCPNCQEAVEVRLNTKSLYQTNADSLINLEIPFAIADYEGVFRPLTLADLAAVKVENDLSSTRQQLLQGCLLSLTQAGKSVGIEQLPSVVMQALEQAYLDADPLAEIRLKLACPTCEQQWLVGLDIAAFLWQELEQQAHKVFNEIHILASAYGWPEADILALSSARRKFYLARICG